MDHDPNKEQSLGATLTDHDIDSGVGHINIKCVHLHGLSNLTLMHNLAVASCIPRLALPLGTGDAMCTILKGNI